MAGNLIGSERSELSVPKYRQNAVFHGRRVDGSVRIRKDAGKAIVDYAPGVTFIESPEPDAVKSDEPVKGRKPKIPVRRLRDRTHAILGQAVIRRPGVEAILCRRRKSRRKQ